MKYLILTLLLFTKISFAENWLNQTKIKSGSGEAYSLKADCERISGEVCFDLGGNPSSIFSEIDIEVDDNSKPIYSKNEIQPCVSDASCDLIFLTKTCTNPQESLIKNYDLQEVYCSRFLSYEKKLQKSIALDSQKLSAWQTQEVVKNQAGQKEAGVQVAIRKIDCGKRVIALLVLRNAPKGLTTAQVAQLNSVYAPIKGLLETASLVTAKQYIEATVADGVIITEADKVDLANETQKCIEIQ